LAYLDLVAGSGLRQERRGLEPAADGSRPHPQRRTVPDYYEINIGVQQTFKVAAKQFFESCALMW
jgi:hypothetical protein